MSAHGNATMTDCGARTALYRSAGARARARVPRSCNVTTNGLLSDSTGPRLVSFRILSPLALYLQSLSYTCLSFTPALSLKKVFFFFFVLPTLFAFLVCFSVPNAAKIPVTDVIS